MSVFRNQYIRGELYVNDIKISNSSLESQNGDINILPTGLKEVLLKADPISALGASTKQYTDTGDANLQSQVTNIIEDPEPIQYEPLQSQDPIVWDTQYKSATVSIEGDGTIFANNPSPLTGNAYSVNIIDTAIYNYTIRTTLKDANSGNIHFVGLFGARVDPIPAFAFVDQKFGAGSTLQGGVQFMINHSSQPSIEYRTSKTSNTSISDSSGAGDLEVAEDYLEFTITDSVITQVNKNGSPLVFTGANFTMTPKKYYFGYHDLNTITGSIRIQTQIISKTLRNDVNTDSLNYKLSNLQNQINTEINGTIHSLNYVELNDITPPSNPLDGQGRLYKKTGDDGIFWKPDSTGAEVDLTQTGIFGSEYKTAESAAVSSTTSDVFQQKLRLTTSSLTGGTYRVGWYFNWNHDDNKSSFVSRVQIDDATTIHNHFEKPHDDGPEQLQTVCGFYHGTLSSGTHTIDIDYRTTDNGKTASMSNARIEFWRVQ